MQQDNGPKAVLIAQPGSDKDFAFTINGKTTKVTFVENMYGVRGMRLNSDGNEFLARWIGPPTNAAPSAAIPSDKPASATDPVTGTYRGIFRGEDCDEMPIKIQIKNEGGSLTGTIGEAEAIGGQFLLRGKYEEGKVLIRFNTPLGGSLIGQVSNGKIVGTLTSAGCKGKVELTRGPAHPLPAQPKAIEGEWDAIGIPSHGESIGGFVIFTLTLHVNGSKVTGEVTLGGRRFPMETAPISQGSFSDNEISLNVDTSHGNVQITGKLLENGRLEGDLVLAYQKYPTRGGWSASKSKSRPQH